jgi:molybdopterin-containing oxidoreductase family membrane subunit
MVPDLAIVRDRLRGRPAWRARLYGLLALGWRGLPAQRRLLDRAVTAVAITIIPLAVIVHSVLSWAFSLTGRPGWDSTIFAPYFVVGALYAGIAMVILVVAGFRAAYRLERYIEPRHFTNLAYLLVTLDLAYLYFTFSELLTEGYIMTEETAHLLAAVLLGQFAPLFWLFILLGGILPLLLVALPRLRSTGSIIAAAGLVVVAMWLKRLVIVVPAVSHPLIAGAWGAFTPTWISVSITVAAAAAIPLLLMLFFKAFPILSIDEMEEVAAEEAQRTHVAQEVTAALAGGRIAP